VNTSLTRVDWARRLAGRGWPVFPLAPGGKHPAPEVFHRLDRCPATGPCRDGHRGWEQRATIDPAAITAFWTAHPRHNIGLATGPAGLVVIDLDVPKPGEPLPEDCIRGEVVCGAQMLARLAADHDTELPDTWTVATPSGGTHLYFTTPPGVELRNTKGGDRGSLGGLIDTRAGGGYVVAPDSEVAGGAYELIWDLSPAELPGWVVQRLAARPSTAISAPRQVASAKISGYVAAALDGEADRVAQAPSGTHNRAQYIAAGALGQLVGGGHLDYDTALARLLDAAAGHIAGPCGCTEHGVRAAFVSGLRYGMDRPRRLTDRHAGHAA
jgi:hypothetical protein